VKYTGETGQLNDGFSQLYLRYSPSSSEIDSAAIGELPAYGAGYWPDEQLAMPEKIDKKRITPKPATSSPQPAPPTNDSPVKLTAAESSLEKSALLAYRNGDSESEEETDSASEPKNTKSGSQTVSSEDLDEMEDDPDAAYIATKMQITTLQRNLGIAGKGGKKGTKAKAKPAAAPIKENKAELEQLQQLETLLKRIQQMYLFDQKRAEAAYAVERARVDKLELAERLAGKAKVRQQAEQPEPTDLPTEQHTPRIPDAIAETSADDSLLGGMLDEATEADVESAEPERNSQGSIIVVRDMSLPKGFTGKTPRSLLEDTIRRLDKFGKSTYRVISRSRAIRAVVTIRWDSGKMQQFGMEDEACENQDQAFHYVSTLALFALAGDTSPQRLLPAKYRELWDELAARSKDHEQQSYRQRLQVYKRLAIGRHASVSPTPSISPSIRPKAIDEEVAILPDNANLARRQRESPEDLIREMQERQNSPSYVAMLVSPALIASATLLRPSPIATTTKPSDRCVSQPYRFYY
jgi:ATP-dependent RNA helicase DHX29